MIQPPNKIQDAINAAEFVASPLKRDNEQVTVDNRTLLVLIDAAKQRRACLQSLLAGGAPQVDIPVSNHQPIYNHALQKRQRSKERRQDHPTLI